MALDILIRAAGAFSQHQHVVGMPCETSACTISVTPESGEGAYNEQRSGAKLREPGSQPAFPPGTMIAPRLKPLARRPSHCESFGLRIFSHDVRPVVSANVLGWRTQSLQIAQAMLTR
jgi:hypothetical protein